MWETLQGIDSITSPIPHFYVPSPSLITMFLKYFSFNLKSGADQLSVDCASLSRPLSQGDGFWEGYRWVLQWTSESIHTGEDATNSRSVEEDHERQGEPLTSCSFNC